MNVHDDQLVDAAAALARAATKGNPPDPAIQSLLHAIAMTRSEKERHRLAAKRSRRADDPHNRRAGDEGNKEDEDR